MKFVWESPGFSLDHFHAAFATVHAVVDQLHAEKGKFTCRQSKLEPEKALTEQSLQQLQERCKMLPTCRLCERTYMTTKNLAKAWEIYFLKKVNNNRNRIDCINDSKDWLMKITLRSKRGGCRSLKSGSFWCRWLCIYPTNRQGSCF